MSDALHVLVLFEYATLNGGENSLLSMVPTLKAKGVHLTALAPTAGPLAGALAALNIPTRPWLLDGQTNRLPQETLAWRQRISEVLAERRPDIVHANSVSISRRLGPVARALAIPSLGHLRDIVGLSHQARDDVQCLDRILAVSQATRAWHVSRGMTNRRLKVLYNGVDLRVFHPRQPTGELQRALGIPETSRLIGCVGQLGMRKGTDIVLGSARLLAREFPDVHWIIVGERHSAKREAIEFCEQLTRLATSSPLVGRVHFLGRRQDMPAVFSQLTMLVHAARQEPLGRVLLEAAATALPVVATSVGGTSEIFRPVPSRSFDKVAAPRNAQDLCKRTGRREFPARSALLVPSDDVQATAVACRRILVDSSLAAELGRVARNRVAGRFDVAKRACELFAHYRRVVHDASTHRHGG